MKLGNAIGSSCNEIVWQIALSKFFIKHIVPGLTSIHVIFILGLDNEELLMCIKLIESGVNPTTLALLVNNVKQQCEHLSELKR